MTRWWVGMAAVLSVAGCGAIIETARMSTQHTFLNQKMAEGPPIEDVVTSFDEALTCLRGKIRPEVIFAVGQVVDTTGKENFADGGTGKFVSQGAGEMVQSALFRAGVSVVNRRDPNIAILESNWGIRDIKRQVPVNFYISGSINSLDFLPGGGAAATVAGVGPRYRQNRILIGLDLTMTDAFTGRVVASVPLQKQIFARELGVSLGRFFGDTLVSLDAGGMEREALHFALRQMLSLATFELLGQIMNPDIYGPCREKVGGFAGAITKTGTADRDVMAAAVWASREAKAEALLVDVKNAGPPAPPAAPGGAPQQAAAAPGQVTKQDVTQQLTRGAVSAAIRSLNLAHESEKAPSREQAVKLAAESIRLSNLALDALKKAAEAGLNGDEGDAAAVVVQQAFEAARKAATAATSREKDPSGTGAPTNGTGPEDEAAKPAAAPLQPVPADGTAPAAPGAATEPAVPGAAVPAATVPGAAVPGTAAPAPAVPGADPALPAPTKPPEVPLVPGTQGYERRFGQ